MIAGGSFVFHWLSYHPTIFKSFTTLPLFNSKAMKKWVLVVFSVYLSINAIAQSDSVAAVNEIEKFQKELDQEYHDPVKSPLRKNAKKFKGHEFFPINLKYRVAAKLKITNNSPFFMMKTTSVVLKEHRVYGILEFSLNGRQYQLP